MALKMKDLQEVNVRQLEGHPASDFAMAGALQECAEIRLDELINGVPGELEIALAAVVNGGV